MGTTIYHARYDIGTTARKRWSCGAGQSLGAFLPPVFAAALLRDETKAHRLRRTAITNHGDDPGEWGPQELRQIKRGVTGVLLWGDGHPIIRPTSELVEQDWRYWADFSGSKCYDSYQGKESGDPNRGKKTAADPYGYIDGPANRPGSAYMSVSFGGFRAFAAAMILMPQIRSIVNTDAPGEQPKAHLFCATPDAKIHYTLDGSAPTAESPVYEGKPLPVTAATRVKAFATLDGKQPSAARTGTLPPPLKSLRPGSRW